MTDHPPTANHPAPPNDDERKPAKRVRLLEHQEEERVLRIAREARDNDALYRALLVRIHKDGYAADNYENGNRIRERVEKYDGDSTGGSIGVGTRSKIVIGENFTWSHYPILENVLRDNMEQYYNMSWSCAQSKQQQEFNNRLVRIIYHTAATNGYVFDPDVYSGGNIPLTQRGKKKKEIDCPIQDENESFTPLPDGFHWKKLRDRIRCYYKTHVQNSKKRLATMLKNPTKPRNRVVLLRAVERIENESSLST
ncbi:hypothetical protein ACHAWX_006293 [Stephanocyclus meneghinianus]